MVPTDTGAGYISKAADVAAINRRRDRDAVVLAGLLKLQGMAWETAWAVCGPEAGELRPTAARWLHSYIEGMTGRDTADDVDTLIDEIRAELSPVVTGRGYAERNAGRDRHNLETIGVPSGPSRLRW